MKISNITSLVKKSRFLFIKYFLYSILLFMILLLFSIRIERSVFFTLSTIEYLEKEIEKFKGCTGHFPRTLDNLLTVQHCGYSFKRGTIPKDAWGSDFVYIFPKRYGNKEFDLYSVGKNLYDDLGREDDVSNWDDVKMENYKTYSIKNIYRNIFAIE